MHSGDRNLLVGVLGLQMELISEAQLVSAMQAWIFKKSLKIEDILLDLKFIDNEKREFLAGLADRHIALHKDDPAKSLASLSSFEPVQKRLKDLEDEDIAQSITRIAEFRNENEPSSHFLNESTVALPASSTQGNHRFRILRPHAKGGLGQVSVAEDTELHREVALKEIQSQYASNPENRNRFLIEAEVTGQLEHPGIVPVYSLGTTESGSPFYVMRFIKGDSLKEAVDRLYDDRNQMSSDDFRMSLRRLVRRLIDVCNAIHYAHSRGVLHRDLKPGNIMLGKYGETLVVDWGLAKTGRKSPVHENSEEQTCIPLSSDASTQTRLGTVVGTLAFMSPEQAEGKLDTLGPASDVYGLGATLFYILTRETPVPKLPYTEVLQRVRAGHIRRPREINANIPAALEAICRKAMALRPLDRYATTAALADDLELWLADQPVTAFREPIRDRVGRFVKKHRTIFTTAVGVLLTFAIALLIVNLNARKQNAILKVARDEANNRRHEAEEQRKIAEQRSAEAISEKKRAEENLSTARNLSIVLLTTAEAALTKPVIDGNVIHDLRKKLTEDAFDNFLKIYRLNLGNSEIAFEFAQVARISSNLKRLDRDLQTANERIQLSLHLQLNVPSDNRTLNQKDYLAGTFREIGTIRKAEGMLAEAEIALNQSLVTSEELLKAQPQSFAYKRTKAVTELEQIGLHSERMELEAALQKSESSSAALQILRSSDGRSDNDDFLLLFALARQIKLLHQLGRHEKAKEVAVAAISLGRGFRLQHPDDVNIALPFARILYWSTEGIVESQGPSDETIAIIDEGLLILDGLVKKSPKASYIYGLGESFRIQGMIFRKQMKFSQAEEALVKSKTWLEKLLKASDTADHQDVLAKTFAEYAAIQNAKGDKPSAAELLRQAVVLEKEACKQSPNSVEMKQFAESLSIKLRLLESP